MADKPKKKVTIVTKKKANPAAASPAVPPTPQPAPGTRKAESRGLLDLQRLLDFPAGVAENAREVWMAGIGALSTVEEAGQAIFDELVRKGEQWERESRQRLLGAKEQAESAAGRARTAAQELGRKPGQLAAEAEVQVQRIVEESVEGVLHRIGVPTHDEVRDLIHRVESLTGKVDALTARLQLAEAPAPAAPTPAVSAPVETEAPATSSTTLYFVVPTEEGWAVQREGVARASSRHGKKAEAVAAARELAKNHTPSRLVIHKQDGSVQTETTYE